MELLLTLVVMKKMEVVKAKVWPMVKRNEKKGIEMKRIGIYRFWNL